MPRTLCLVMSVLWIVVLAACGGSASAPTAVVSTPVAAPTSAAVATTSGALTPGAAAAGPFADLEQGTTPEGYHTLGKAAAPATLVMYSDFL